MIKGHNPNTLNKKAKSPYLSGYQILILPGCFGFKISEYSNNALHFNHTQLEKCVLKLVFLNGHQSLRLKTGSLRKCEIFDG